MERRHHLLGAGICGTSFGLTKLAASSRRRPAAVRRSQSSARTEGSRIVASFWSPSRGPTSQISTLKK